MKFHHVEARTTTETIYNHLAQILLYHVVLSRGMAGLSHHPIRAKQPHKICQYPFTNNFHENRCGKSQIVLLKNRYSSFLYPLDNHTYFSTTEGSDKKITALESENKNIFEKLMEMEMRMKQMSTLQHPALTSKPSEVNI